MDAPTTTSKQLSKEQKVQILLARANGRSYSDISCELGYNRTTASRFCRRYEASNSIDRTKGSGRKRKTSEREDRAIVNFVKRNRFATAKEMKAVLPLPSLCYNTIRSRIKEGGQFESYWAVRKPYVSLKNRKKRVIWCKQHVNWTQEQWPRVLWSDESPFVLAYHARKRVWRMHNERYAPNCILGTVKHDKKINVWGCFCSTGVGRLHLIQGIMDQEQYLDILEEPMLHSADVLFGRENWIFQQDNDPKHTAKRVTALVS